MKWSFSGLATTLKLSAGLTALPHSSIYQSELHRANEFTIIIIIIIVLNEDCLKRRLS
jgi:hypothetical protein